MKAELVLDAKATLGEGPVWHAGALYWVDIMEGHLHRFDPATGANQTVGAGEPIGAAVPRAGGGWVAALRSGLAFVDFAEGKVEAVFACPEGERPGTRFNDGKCDRHGRFWVGTMGLRGEAGLGTLYVLEPGGAARVMVKGVGVSNGLAWSADGHTMFYVDTPTREVSAFDCDGAAGTIANRRPAVRVPDAMGHPDGMAIDRDGLLWIGLWGGHAVACADPATGKIVERVELPVPNVTSCAFGGPDLDTLYITTHGGRECPEAGGGGVFAVKPGARGFVADTFGG